ncbi:hypothetical protein P1S61_38960 [Streptomyces sp. ME08-AFT2]|uniref:hypothetical protein n=1 Tax=Streptomyces sp. ME08-AFT2 TaxID=3028683 RepID=UPI0029B9DA4E|nr:hypothetical protein [Streptomyces sp. ME08-AFT2]MDX3314934.1 hypothetical protein [Streptomyces sp. ME08-AFT2]
MPSRSTPPAPPTRRRVRPLAVALTAAAALTLTACHDGQGLRDEGPSNSSTVTGLRRLDRLQPLTDVGPPPRNYRSFRAASVAQ